MQIEEDTCDSQWVKTLGGTREFDLSEGGKLKYDVERDDLCLEKRSNSLSFLFTFPVTIRHTSNY